MKVLVTGATGYVAEQVLPAYRERFDLVLLDVKEQDRHGNRVEGVTVADVSASDRSGYERYFEGVDAVVHLAYRAPRVERIDAFEIENDNVKMAYNVFRTAHDTGVRRVVCASSVHAADYTEGLVRERRLEMVDPYALPLAEQFYGWSKASMEHMGFLFARGKLGRSVEVVMVRIASPNDNKVLNNTNPDSLRMYLGSYISPQDISQLFVKAVEAPDIRNEDGIPWAVVYGAGNNTRGYYSLVSGRKALGYEPQDDSEVKFADVVRERLIGPGHAGQMG